MMVEKARHRQTSGVGDAETELRTKCNSSPKSVYHGSYVFRDILAIRKCVCKNKNVSV